MVAIAQLQVTSLLEVLDFRAGQGQKIAGLFGHLHIVLLLLLWLLRHDIQTLVIVGLELLYLGYLWQASGSLALLARSLLGLTDVDVLGEQLRVEV